MISDREIREDEEWKAVAAALKDESDIPPASQDFTSRCLHAALRGQRPAGWRQLWVRRSWLRVAAAAAALCALTAAGAAAILGSRGAALRAAEIGKTGENSDYSPVATTTTPVPPDSPVPPVPDVPSTTLSEEPTMNTTTLRTLAASAAIAAAGAAAPANATADIAWPSGLDAQVAALAASALPSGDSASFGTVDAFDSNGAVVRRTDGFGAAETPFDSVGSVVRFTAGSNLVTTQFPFCIIVR